MVVTNRISARLSQQEMDRVMGLIESIYAVIPFLVGLSPKERLRLNSAGDLSSAFIRRCCDVAPLVADYLPRGLDIDELRKDIELMDALQVISAVVSKLAQQLSDTRALASSEAYTAALEVYSAAKKAREREGMDQVVQELARRFARTGHASAEPVEPDADAEPEDTAAAQS